MKEEMNEVTGSTSIRQSLNDSGTVPVTVKSLSLSDSIISYELKILNVKFQKEEERKITIHTF